MRKLLLLLWLLPLAVSAQSSVGVAVLSNGWRVQSGDDLAWAQPGFDDSGWRLTSLEADAASVRPGWRWYRMRVDLPRDAALAMLVVGPDNQYEVYVNGTPLAGSAIRSRLFTYSAKERVLPIPGGGGPAEIAIRVRYPRVYTEIYGLCLSRILLGPESAIEARRQLAENGRLLVFLPSCFINLALFLSGCGALLLFFLHRTSREYLWLGLNLAASGISAGIFFASITAVAAIAANACIGDPLGYLVMIFQIEFTYAFANRKVDRIARVYEGILLAFIPGAVLVNVCILPPQAYLLAEALANLPVALILPVLLLVWFLRGNREAGWLILPSLLPSASSAANDFGLIGLAQKNGLARLIQPIFFGPVGVNPDDLADFAFLLAIAIVMALRFTRVSREQLRAAAELDAAREIQQRLVPLELPPVAGCRMEAAYVPAQEVGGDFYQVLELAGGSSLIVIGDVSGKGLRAAMTGALAMGVLRTLAAENLSPAALLVGLNRQILSAQDDGFVTCLCATVTSDGIVTAANAGHLPPYRNGDEVVMESGLPLGIIDDVEYAEEQFQLTSGDTLTFLSDGVVEAQNAKGELFGFDRTCAISAQPAREIAQTAQRFGQVDDITVLTLAFAGAPVAQL